MEDLVLKGYYNTLPLVISLVQVVEDLVLKGYYNPWTIMSHIKPVVEDLVLKGYYNLYFQNINIYELWKTLF